MSTNNLNLNATGSTIVSGDFNGDGKTDFIVTCPGCGWTTSPTFTSNGDGTWTITNPTLQSGDTNASSTWMNAAGSTIVSGDFNGDGKTDFIIRCPGCGWTTSPTFTANGDGTWTITNPTLQSGATNASSTWLNAADSTVLVGDFDGDGKTDFIVSCPGCGWTTSPTFFSMSDNGGRLRYVANGLSTSISNISYVPLAQALGKQYSRQLKGSPSRNIISPTLRVVTDVDASNGLGGTRRTSYWYDSMALEVGTGRGLLGFQWVQSKDMTTGLVNRTCYRQDWPYVGMVDKTLKATSDSGLPACTAISDLSLLMAPSSNLLSLGVSQYTFTATDSSGVATTCSDISVASCASGAIKPQSRYQVYSSQGLTQSRDWDGTTFFPLPATRTKVLQDSWGNTTSVTVDTLNADGVTASGYSKTTINTYVPVDTTNWLLGRLKQSSVTVTTP
jgi:sarcosine oxidase delta subunit